MSKWLLRTLFWFSILITTYYTLMNLYDCLRRAKAQRELLPPAVRGVVTKCPNVNSELSKLMSMKKKNIFASLPLQFMLLPKQKKTT